MASGEGAANGGAGVKIGGTVSEPVRQTVRRQIATGARWRGAADRARRAVALSGGVCYTFNRCATMGGEIPTAKQENGTIKTFSRPVNGLPRPVVYFTRLRGGIFANGGEIP